MRKSFLETADFSVYLLNKYLDVYKKCIWTDKIFVVQYQNVSVYIVELIEKVNGFIRREWI